nr:zinc finger with UFM1-specific peptidase domain protein-like [Cryptomonas curvata]
MGNDNAVVIPKICNAVLKSYQNSWPRDLVQIYICSPLDFHAQTMNWDCGYRNMQSMLSSYLNHDSIIRDQLFTAGILLIPTLLDLQKKIENAWLKGFDQIGGMQLEYSLSGTNKWIGATEVVAMLRSCRIRACVADFDYTSGQCDLNTMVQVIWEYFENRCEKRNLFMKNNSLSDCSFVAPLYLQHQGHSRLVVGVEKWANGDIKLLILDPQMRRALQLSQRQGDEANILRQGVTTHGLNSKSKYQIAYLAEKSLYFDENEHSKVIVDELRHPKLRFI